MRQTKQKQILQELIAKQKGFFDAKDLLDDAKKDNIGIATIYRFLSAQAKEGMLHTYQCNRRTIYTREQKCHAHFTCERCQTTKHIHIKNVDFLQEELDDTICHFQLDVTGLCKKCKD